MSPRSVAHHSTRRATFNLSSYFTGVIDRLLLGRGTTCQRTYPRLRYALLSRSTIWIKLPCNSVGNLFVITFEVQPRVEPQGNGKSSPMKIIDATALSGFARKTAESGSDFADVVHNLIMDVRDCYRAGLHYMRGPGPKWRAKHPNSLSLESEAVQPPGQHQPPPVYIRPCDAANPAR